MKLFFLELSRYYVDPLFLLVLGAIGLFLLAFVVCYFAAGCK